MRGACVRSSEDAQVTRLWYGACVCVRCVRAARDSSYTKEMRYGSPVTLNDRAPAPAPRAARCAARSARHKRPRRAPFQPSLHLPFDLPLQAVADEHVGNNTIQDRLYGMGFLQSKPANLQCKTSDRGGGGSTWIYDGDDDALAPSDFFAPTGPPSRTGSRTRRHAMLHLACVVGRVSVPSLVL